MYPIRFSIRSRKVRSTGHGGCRRERQFCLRLSYRKSKCHDNIGSILIGVILQSPNFGFEYLWISLSIFEYLWVILVSVPLGCRCIDYGSSTGILWDLDISLNGLTHMSTAHVHTVCHGTWIRWISIIFTDTHTHTTFIIHMITYVCQVYSMNLLHLYVKRCIGALGLFLQSI